MKSARIQSFGIIPIHESASGQQVLLVEQYGAEGTHWGFPKGKINPGEQPLEAAKREVKEEVGLSFKEVLDDRYFTVNYTFTYEDTIVDKTVTYFIGYVEQPGLALQQSEVKDAVWLSFEEAKAKLTYENTQSMFESALTHLASHTKHA